MGLIKVPNHTDLSTKSEPYTKQELADFREIMQDIKNKNAKSKEKLLQSRANNLQSA